MKMRLRPYRSVGVGLIAVFVGSATVATQSRSGSSDAARVTDEVLLEHIREAEDAVELLLDRQPVIVAEDRQPTPIIGEPGPKAPASTLVTLPLAEVQRLVAAIDAVAGMIPQDSSTSPEDASTRRPRGDLRAHAEKAQEIAGELLRGHRADAPVGTSGSSAGVTLDRAALERLEVEIDAMERIAPRT